jgi:hypothetical protein
MLSEEVTTAIAGAVVFSCRECKEPSQGVVLTYERRQLYFGIPFVTERQVLLKCDACGAEHLTVGVNPEELADLPPEAIDQYVAKIKSPLFPKLLIVQLAMSWFLPLVGPIVYAHLRPYREYIRGRWRRAYRFFLYLSLLSQAGWVFFVLYMVIAGEI